jgi:hypothetical protein
MGLVDHLLCRGLSRDRTILRIFIVSGFLSLILLISGAVWAFTTIDYANEIKCTVVDRFVTKTQFSKCTDTTNYEYHYKVLPSSYLFLSNEHDIDD